MIPICCSDPNDTLVMEEERKKIYIPSETKRIVDEQEQEEKDSAGSAVSAVFSALTPGGQQPKASPAISDRGYGSDRGSDTSGEGTNEAKKILYASDTYKAVKEEEKLPSFGGPSKPIQSRTLNMLQRQLE